MLCRCLCSKKYDRTEAKGGMYLNAEEIALIAAGLAFVLEQLLPRLQSVEGNSVSEVVANLLRSRCLRPSARSRESAPASTPI